MNPLGRLLPALYTLLITPPLTLAGVDIDVYEHLPGNSATNYVLLTSPTAVAADGATACRHWSCTATIDVVTQFPTNVISSVPVEELVAQIAARIEGPEGQIGYPRLTLPAGYECHPATLELHSQLPLGVPSLYGVRRLLRYRWEVFYNL